ncbi:hypothetical protein CASFOL_008329 [Castilleja foliolosa]|uniref:KIB1-4 beta-propeller domain-containing protein n=1 Tax=Castilleja foliolosa TaxID=1961234 RepID=A0ABD3DYN8_9LAMI
MGLCVFNTLSRRRSSFRLYGVARVSTVNRRAESQVSSFSSSDDDSLFSSSSSYSFVKNKPFTIPISDKTRNATKNVGSSHCWLACLNHRRNELYLSNPLSGRHLNLPPLNNLDIPKSCCSDPESKECRAMMIYNHSSKELAFCNHVPIRSWWHGISQNLSLQVSVIPSPGRHLLCL